MNKKIYQRPRATVIALDATVMDLALATQSDSDDAKGYSKTTGDSDFEGDFFD